MTIVWNDPVNLMSYVTYVFQKYFGYSKKKAEKLMMEVHEDGKSVVSHGSREEMERDVQAMHEYGLWATHGQAGVSCREASTGTAAASGSSPTSPASRPTCCARWPPSWSSCCATRPPCRATTSTRSRR